MLCPATVLGCAIAFVLSAQVSQRRPHTVELRLLICVRTAHCCASGKRKPSPPAPPSRAPETQTPQDQGSQSTAQAPHDLPVAAKRKARPFDSNRKASPSRFARLPESQNFFDTRSHLPSPCAIPGSRRTQPADVPARRLQSRAKVIDRNRAELRYRSPAMVPRQNQKQAADRDRSRARD